MINELSKIKVGLADVEKFNRALKGNLKNLNSPQIIEMQDKKTVNASTE